MAEDIIPLDRERRRTRKRRRRMLRPLESPHLDRVAKWLARKENYQWLYFGAGRQSLDAVTLRVMTQRDLHLLRLYAPEPDHDPVGLVALSDIDRDFRTANVWFVLGEKEFGGRGLTKKAVSLLLELGFDRLDLGAVHAWTVEKNEPSQSLLRSLGFRLMGRQRECHYIDGVAYDRLLYDLLADEFESR